MRSASKEVRRIPKESSLLLLEFGLLFAVDTTVARKISMAFSVLLAENMREMRSASKEVRFVWKKRDFYLICIQSVVLKRSDCGPKRCVEFRKLLFYGKIPTFFSCSETVFQLLWNDITLDGNLNSCRGISVHCHFYSI